MVKVMKKDSQDHNLVWKVRRPVTFRAAMVRPGGVAPRGPPARCHARYSPHLPGHGGGVCPGGAGVCGGRGNACPEVCVTRYTRHSWTIVLAFQG